MHRVLENIELRAELATAKDRIATLESELASKREALNRLLADDLRTSEELAQLQENDLGLPSQAARQLHVRCLCGGRAEPEGDRRLN